MPQSTPPAHAPSPAGSTPRKAWRTIEESLESRADRWVKFRRRIHATPEPSGQERATTALVAEQLRESGLAPTIMAGEVGVTAEIDLGAAGDTFIALRAELDCVPVHDDKQVAYASTHPGLCHACGHDAHATIVLAAAAALRQNAGLLRGMPLRHNVRLIFQPAEETATGARSMIHQGALSGVEAIVALHVDPTLDAGRIGLRTGAMTAACKTFRVTVQGRGGHSARPFEALDPIPAAVMLIDQFYQLGPRSMDGRYPLALTIGSITAGSAANAIPNHAVMLGTLRTARIQDTEAVQARMEAIVRGVTESTGCEVTLDFLQFCPATENDPALVKTLAEAIGDLLGPAALHWIEVPSLGGEDFAFYQELVPGAFLRLGAAPQDPRARRPLHSSHFDIDETALLVGAKVLCRAALELAAAPSTPPA
jgi:amidohydrolase